MSSRFHPFTYIDGKIKNKHYPKVLEIDLTNQCNQNCKWCKDKQFRDELPHTLPFDLVERLFKQLYKKGLEAVLFTGGGEPSLFPGFSKILKRAKDFHYKVGIITNGERLRNHYDSIKENVDLVQISLDAGKHTTYIKLHNSGPHGYLSVMDNLKTLAKVKDRKFSIGVSYLVDASNYFELPKILEFLAVLKIDYINISPVYIKGFTLSGKVKDRVYKAIEEAKDYEYKINCDLDFIEDRGSFSECIAHRIISVVGADGKLYPCPGLRGKAPVIFGDLKSDTFKNVWHGKRRATVIDKLDVSRCPEFCKYKKFNSAYSLLVGNGGELL